MAGKSNNLVFQTYTDPHAYYHELVSPTKGHPVMVYNHATGLDTSLRHWHRSIELCCFINTPVRLWSNGTEYELEEDALIIVNSGDVHQIIPASNPEPHGVSLIFPYDFLLENNVDAQKITFTYKAGQRHDNQLRQSLHRISELLESDIPYMQTLVNAEIYKVLYLLLSNYQGKESHDYGIPVYHMDRCKQMLSYIDNNYADKITLESLSEHFNLSVAYIARYFQKYLGVTFKSHLTGVRLQNAVQMLRAGDKSMIAVAMNCGFPDYRSFSNTFKKWFHTTPLRYLNELESGERDGEGELFRPELVFAQHIRSGYTTVQADDS